MSILKNLSILCLSACFIWGCASGSTVMLSGIAPEMPTPLEQIKLFIEPPDQPYAVIALVNATADTEDFRSVAQAEGAALEKLKEQAAKAGADGVTDIVREMLDGGLVIYSDSLRNYYHEHRNTHSSTTLSRSYAISYKGKAIKFTEK